MQKIRGINEWVDFLSQVEIPVLRQTSRELASLQANEDALSARNVAHVIKVDPLMSIKLLRYLQGHKHRVQEHEVVEIEQALIMLGLNTFYSKVPAQPMVDTLLAGHKEALVCLLHVVQRSRRASEYAMDWAVYLRDLHFEEIRMVTLLHDIAELLLWCFAPTEMWKIHLMQQQDKTLRSHTAQQQILGFEIIELQIALTKKWHLPELLLTLLQGEDADAAQPRVRNVALAVNLARHLSHGWNDAALPDDYQEISALLHVQPEQVLNMLGVGTKKIALSI